MAKCCVFAGQGAQVPGMGRDFAEELGSRNVRCNAVAPGFIVFAMTDKLPDEVMKQYAATIPLGRFGTVEDIANCVAWLPGDQLSYVTGQVISVNCGMV